MTELNETIGNFYNIENISTQGEYLQLGFQPNSAPLKERWRNNGLSADFMGDYVTTFFPKVENDPHSITRQTEIKSAVSYIANELLENAMKYSDSNLGKSISISLILEQTQIIITEVNISTNDQALSYRNFAAKLTQNDPMEMYLEQLESSAVDDTTSGLGFLTMLNDYNAELAWKFTTSQQQAETTITTEVILPI